MIVLFIGVSLFFISLSLHIFIWRFSIPRNQRRTLLIIFILILVLGMSSIIIIDTIIGLFKINTSILLIQVIHIVLLYTGLTLAYIVTYSALEVDSPSLVIINIIVNNKEGISVKDLYRNLTDDMLLKPRLEDLSKENMAIKIDDIYYITQKGANMARLFNFYRKILNISASGG